jgi:pimeloyl-ACP methyl ester carboxylesterase
MRRWARLGLTGSVALSILLLLAGATYERISASRASSRHPAPGTLVDVGGYRLHLRCEGSGSPTVIFESGGGGSSLDWRFVQAPIATFTRACAYDRAGIAWSDLGPHRPTAERVASDLYTLVRNAKINGPFVLVGHSLGGLFAQQFAFRHSDEVVGLVFVDACHPELATRNPPAVRAAMRKLERLARVMSVGAEFGVARALGISAGVPSSGITPDEAARVSAIAFRPSWFRMNAAYLAAFDISCAQVRAEWRTLNVPLVVLSHAKYDHILPFLSEPDNREHERIFAELQSDLARLSLQGRLVVVSDSGHAIMIDRPAAVVSAVEQVVTACRQLDRTRGGT